MTILAKIHKRPDGTILLALCDKELIGQVKKEGAHKIDTTGQFYKGEEASEEEISEIILQATHLNFVGEGAVRLGIKTGYVEKDRILRVAGIPYAECAIIKEN